MKTYYNQNKERLQAKAREYYKQNREKVLARHQETEVKARRKIYRQKPEVKASDKLYRQRPAVRQRMKIYHRKHVGLPTPTRPIPSKCECCGNPPKTNALSLDHNHRSGEFRGWLCIPCNTGIGALGDSVAGLIQAIRYLNRADLL